jgi:hypothetical protein
MQLRLCWSDMSSNTFGRDAGVCANKRFPTSDEVANNSPFCSKVRRFIEPLTRSTCSLRKITTQRPWRLPRIAGLRLSGGDLRRKPETTGHSQPRERDATTTLAYFWHGETLYHKPTSLGYQRFPYAAFRSEWEFSPTPIHSKRNKSPGRSSSTETFSRA